MLGGTFWLIVRSRGAAVIGQLTAIVAAFLSFFFVLFFSFFCVRVLDIP